MCLSISFGAWHKHRYNARRADLFKGANHRRGIVYSDVIIAAGFAIFVLSDFPPTQRFGLVVLAGCIIDILANLFVLPLLGGAQWKKK